MMAWIDLARPRRGARPLAEQAFAHHRHADDEQRQDHDRDHGEICTSVCSFPLGEQIPESRTGARG